MSLITGHFNHVTDTPVSETQETYNYYYFHKIQILNIKDSSHHAYFLLLTTVALCGGLVNTKYIILLSALDITWPSSNHRANRVKGNERREQS